METIRNTRKVHHSVCYLFKTERNQMPIEYKFLFRNVFGFQVQSRNHRICEKTASISDSRNVLITSILRNAKETLEARISIVD